MCEAEVKPNEIVRVSENQVHLTDLQASLEEDKQQPAATAAATGATSTSKFK
jgi:hypothetical protein